MSRDSTSSQHGITSDLLTAGYAVVPGIAAEHLDALRQLWSGVAAPDGFLSSARDLPQLERVDLDRSIKETLGQLGQELLPGSRPIMAALINRVASDRPTDFHQDLTYTDERTHRSYVLWVPLVDTTIRSGAIQVVPGSHLWGDGLRPGGTGGTCDIHHLQGPLRAISRTIPAAAGSAVIWDSALLHGTAPNLSSVPRPAAAISLASADADLVYFHISKDGSLSGYAIDDKFLASNRPFVDPPTGYSEVSICQPLATAIPLERAIRTSIPTLGSIPMTNKMPHRGETDPDLAYLVVDEFLGGFLETVALDAAMRSGLIDLALEEEQLKPKEFSDEIQLLICLLISSGILVPTDGDRVELSSRFRCALQHLELLSAKLHYSLRLAGDLSSTPEIISGVDYEPPAAPRYVNLFSYRRANSDDPRDAADTEDWVRYMTVLTRSESPFLIKRLDLASRHRVMDIGGNSGEFALQMCDLHPHLEATVVDLPGVVRIGEKWNADRINRERVTYAGIDALCDDLPNGHDLITFKGVLHDWNDPLASEFIGRAWQALEPGGSLVILERSRVELDARYPVPMAHITMVSWGWVLRGPDRYIDTLTRLGVPGRAISVDEFQLDLPWLMLVARKGAA